MDHSRTQLVFVRSLELDRRQLADRTYPFVHSVSNIAPSDVYSESAGLYP